MFLILCGVVIVLSQILYLANVSATSEVAVAPTTHSEIVEEGGSTNPGYEITHEQDPGAYQIHRETTHAEGLLTGAGLRFIFTSAVDNFNGFGVAGTILVAMIGVGVAEEAGLIGALIRKLVKRAPPYTITFIIVLVGIISSIASDAGYLVLIPLGAAAFYSLGRHPLAGLAAAYAGVSAAFAVNVLITPHRRRHHAGHQRGAAPGRTGQEHQPDREPVLLHSVHPADGHRHDRLHRQVP